MIVTQLTPEIWQCRIIQEEYRYTNHSKAEVNVIEIMSVDTTNAKFECNGGAKKEHKYATSWNRNNQWF